MKPRFINIVFAIFAWYYRHVQSHFACVGTCYQGNFLEESHAQFDKALIGHSFRNLTAHAPQECLTACLSSCRCMAFQLQGTTCELLDEDRLLAPNDFQNSHGYKYFDVKQALDRHVSNTFINL